MSPHQRPLLLDPAPLSCPKWSDILPRRNYDHLRLHVKDVTGSVDYAKLRALPMSDLSSSRLEAVLKWVEDPQWYQQFKLPPYRRYTARFTLADRLELTRVRKFINTKPRCSVRAFCVPEWDKDRKRPIFWPDLNEAISKSLLIPGLLPLKSRVRSDCAASAWSVQFDFASWYDQLPLALQISSFFSFDGRSCLAALPMGFRPAADVAHCITAAIADFPLPAGVTVTCYIDNIRFGGPSNESVSIAAQEFLRRVDAVGAVLNDRSIAPTQEEEFLGEHYNLVTKVRSLTKKTRNKLASAVDLVDKPMSVRQLAAIYGLLFFSSEVINTGFAQFFTAIRFYRSVMRSVADWDAPAPFVPPEVSRQLYAWFDLLSRNRPTPISPSDPGLPELTIYCDACEIGWGAVCISPEGSRHLAQEWSAEDKVKFDVGHSTVSEPLAVRRAVALAVKGGYRHVRIMSDHQGLVFAGNKGYGKCRSYNDMCYFLKNYTNTKFSFGFVPGAENTTADRLSREGHFHINKTKE